MIKLITPPGLLVTVALLAIYVAFALQTALIEKSWLLAGAATVALVACIGTALMKPWSRHLVYLITAGFIGKWCWSIFDGFRAGYYGFQFGSSREAILALVPGLLMVVLSCVCAWLVYRHFHRVGPARGHDAGGPV
jgi:hypothetical protein